MSVYMNKDNVINGLVLYDIVDGYYRQYVNRFNYLYKLYMGEHDLLKGVQPDVNKPNNKLINNFFGEIVDTAVGYFLGNPIVINIDDLASEEEFNKILRDNEINDIILEAGKEASIKGESRIMVYQDENGDTKILKLPAEEVIFVYDSGKIDQLLYAIRVYELDLYEKNVIKKIRYAEVWDKYKVSYWIEDINGGVFIPDVEKEDEEHIFGDVPFVDVLNNSEKLGDFEKVINLVNDYDKVLSNNSNELEAFRHAYLMIKNMQVDSTTLERLKQQGVIEVLENGDVKFITKDLPTEFMKLHLDRLENNIYRFTQTPNLSDEKFANNLSGVAIKFKLFGLETKCIQKELKLRKALKRLLKLISVPIKVKTGKELDLSKVDIHFTRNLPSNVVELADVVTKLSGIVDKETLLGLLPFVDDPKSILNALAEEKDIYSSDMKGLIE